VLDKVRALAIADVATVAKVLAVALVATTAEPALLALAASRVGDGGGHVLIDGAVATAVAGLALLVGRADLQFALLAGPALETVADIVDAIAAITARVLAARLDVALGAGPVARALPYGDVYIFDAA